MVVTPYIVASALLRTPGISIRTEGGQYSFGISRDFRQTLMTSPERSIVVKVASGVLIALIESLVLCPL